MVWKWRRYSSLRVFFFSSSSSKGWNLFLFLAAPCRACRVSSSAMTRPTSTLLPSLVDNTHLSDPFFLSFILFIPSLLILPQSAPFFCLLPENIPTTDRMYQGKDIGKKDYRRYSAVYPRPYMSVDAVSILPYMQACRLMIVRLQTSYRSRLPSLRRQCLVCVERERLRKSLTLFFSYSSRRLPSTTRIQFRIQMHNTAHDGEKEK